MAAIATTPARRPRRAPTWPPLLDLPAGARRAALARQGEMFLTNLAMSVTLSAVKKFVFVKGGKRK